MTETTSSPGITLIDMLQLHHTKGDSGTLKVRDSIYNESGWITFERGEVINCGLGETENQKALVELCQRKSLHYEYVDELLLPVCMINKNFIQLIMEVAVEIDNSALISSHGAF